MTNRKFTEHRNWASPATIGFLGATTHSAWSEFVGAFRQRLRELGWIDGHNIDIDFQWADGRTDRYASIAADFARQNVDVIVTSGTAPTLAAKRATKTIPIVFAAAGDPVRTGLVGSLARPGGNVTGLSNSATNLAGRRLDKLRRALPHLKTLAIVGNQDSHLIKLEVQHVEREARRRRLKTVICDIRSASQIAPAIKALKGKVDALYVCTDPLTSRHRIGINTVAVSAKLPTMHAFRDYVEAGGLLSYGPDFRAMFGSAADLVDEILRGGNPAAIPVEERTQCELVINLTTAKALDLTIPGSLRRGAETIR